MTPTNLDATARHDVVDALSRFLAQHVPAAAGVPIDEETPLVGAGLLDSLGILQLSMHLGDAFGVEVGDEDFTEANFATVGSVARFVVERLDAASR